MLDLLDFVGFVGLRYMVDENSYYDLSFKTIMESFISVSIIFEIMEPRLHIKYILSFLYIIRKLTSI